MSGTSYVAAPRLQLLINGTAIPALSADVDSNNYYHADTFKASLLFTDPKVSGAGFGATFWGAQETGQNPIMVSVQIDPGTSGQANWTELLLGRIDHVEIDPITGIVDLTGRDRTADFLETKTFKAYKNQTSSQIAAALAAEHQMQTQITATTTLVDRYYTTDHDKLTLNDLSRVTTEWDLLTTLAQYEGFDVWVKGSTLYFQPPQPLTQSPLVINLAAGNPWVTANAVDVKFGRALTLARDIMVTVQSWNSKSKTKFSVTAKATGTKKGSAGIVAPAGQSTTQNYVFTRPNLTHEQAQALANQKLAELSRHERVITIDMPGDVTTQPRQGLQITGTGTDWDMAYYIDDIGRRIDARDGFKQTIVAKNQSPKDTTSVG
jgi:phage protein D